MSPIRELLMFLRRQESSDRTGFLVKSGIVVGFSLVFGVLLDVFTPFGGLWMVLRSLVLIPMAGGMFSLFYILGLDMHRNRMENDENWVPYRLRYSLSWRRRIAVIVAAFLAVFMYGMGNTVAYTITAGLVVASIIALFAYIRPTRDEAIREELEIPDARDIQYNYNKRKNTTND